jgi:hypothetical protein
MRLSNIKVIKSFSSSLTAWQNKLECLYLACFFQAKSPLSELSFVRYSFGLFLQISDLPEKTLQGKTLYLILPHCQRSITRVNAIKLFFFSTKKEENKQEHL